MCEKARNFGISIHSLRMEGDRRGDVFFADFGTFQSTPSVWRETRHFRRLGKNSVFQSTPSVWRETRIDADCGYRIRFQSTPSVWRETDAETQKFCGLIISIHSLRMEGDTTGTLTRWRCSISIHSLRMEGDAYLELLCDTEKDFNPLPPYGGRPKRFPILLNNLCISIHSLRMEGDKKFNEKFPADKIFQSTPSVWRETQSLRSILERRQNFNPLPPYGGRLHISTITFGNVRISIHSLRMEGDWVGDIENAVLFHFNPLPPYGGRRRHCPRNSTSNRISIHSLRMEGDGQGGLFFFRRPEISIHSLRMEGD